jgi:tetratricopeptide (TPR) repeat protein
LREQLQKTLGDAYRLERELGGGGMSRVFLAEERRLERKVVVKVLSPDLAQGLSAERFEREIRTVAALQQANIVPVLTAGETDGLPFYTMPFVEGESLRVHLGRGPVPINEVISIVRDVAKALGYAHQRGVVHRDIKPDNVLLSGGTAVVTDFGIAKAISAARTDSGSETLTQIGTSIGTPAYMAPEQAAGDPNVDHRADIYALGAMAYELLAGHPVFANRTPQRMLAAHMSEAPRPVAELRGDVPASLAELVMRCLAKNPDERPPTAGDIARVLDTITSGGGSPAMPAVLLGGPGMFKKALAIYAAAFVVVAVVARAAIIGIGLPEWVFAGSLIVMALGLPVVLWTGYVQRVTRRALAATPTFTPGGTPSTTHGTLANIALKAAPHVSWYRTARGGMYAFGVFIALVAAFMTLRSLGIGPFGTLLAAGRLSGRDPILLTDFKTTNADTSLGRVVSDAVRAGLSGSSAFTLMSPVAIVGSLERMQKPSQTRIDFETAREIAQREGLKAIVDGEITGVEGGYIVSIRLVRADSAIVLASFRETGTGPQGLIDAADKLARALRGKAGESLRSVNATPSLSRATTSSLDALRKYSEANRANSVGNPRSIILAREAVALDSTFASAWSGLAANLSNFGGTQSAIDSALANAYKYRDRLPVQERDAVTARYFWLGPGRDRRKALAAYEAILQRDSIPAVMVNLGEVLRSRREFARAESLNVAASRLLPDAATSRGNTIELQLDQGKVKEAAAIAVQMKEVSAIYAAARRPYVLYAQGELAVGRAFADSILKVGGEARRRIGLPAARAWALLDGRLRDYTTYTDESKETRDAPLTDDEVFGISVGIAAKGPTPADVARLEAAIARIAFRDLPMVDRPYLGVAGAYARAGSVEKARAMLARYNAEMTDTSLRRVQTPDLHDALAEIALASGKPLEALTEFRLGDIAYDGGPADECAPCLSFNLARAYDAAGKADSAVMMFEKYLATPYWLKASAEMDPLRLPAMHERLGQLYEAMGKSEKAAEHYRAFIDLWKNADPELQPRVADAKRRLARLTPVEKPRQ